MYCVFGELFVYCNIVNLFYFDDDNFVSVFEYVVWVLKVDYVIVCGYYGCGGVCVLLLLLFVDLLYVVCCIVLFCVFVWCYWDMFDGFDDMVVVDCFVELNVFE